MKEKRKYPITKENFKKLIEPIIKKGQKKPGRTTKVSHYKFFCGVLYILRTGIPWRDLPKEYGNWHTIYTRYKRWTEKGFFWLLLYQLQSLKQVLIDIVFVDGSVVPLHRHRGRALKKKKPSINREGKKRIGNNDAFSDDTKQFS